MASFPSQEKAWLRIVHLQGYDQIASKRRNESCSSDVVVLDYFSIHGMTIIITCYPYRPFICFSPRLRHQIRILFLRFCIVMLLPIRPMSNRMEVTAFFFAQYSRVHYFHKSLCTINGICCSSFKLICPSTSHVQEGESKQETIWQRLDRRASNRKIGLGVKHVNCKPDLQTSRSIRSVIDHAPKEREMEMAPIDYWTVGEIDPPTQSQKKSEAWRPRGNGADTPAKSESGPWFEL